MELTFVTVKSNINKTEAKVFDQIKTIRKAESLFQNSIN